MKIQMWGLKHKATGEIYGTNKLGTIIPNCYKSRSDARFDKGYMAKFRDQEFSVVKFDVEIKEVAA